MRFFVWLMFGLLLSQSLACGGCGPDPCDGVECVEGFVCSEGQCVDSASLCDPACEGDQICREQECVDVEPQCEAVREPCDPFLPVNDGFFCIDTDNDGPLESECVELCGAGGTCPDGTLCFVVNSPFDAACSTDADCDSGQTCDQLACRDQICRPSECDGYISGLETCQTLHEGEADFPNGAQCFAVTNGTNFCFPAGTRDVGETCDDLITAFDLQDFTDTCLPGLACIDNACRRACETDEQCEGTDECLLAADNFVDQGVGFCGQSCTPFETGECPENTTCFPIDPQNGVCIPAGDTEAFEECIPGEGDCVDGTLCVTYEQTTGLARCQPLCNVSVAAAGDDGVVGDFAQSQRDATCPQPPPVGTFFRIVNLAELATAVDVYMGNEMTPSFSDIAFDSISDADAATAGDQYLELMAQQYNIRVLPAGAPSSDPSLFELSVNLNSEDANSLVLLPVPQTPDEAFGFVVGGVRGEPAPVAGSGRVRILHALADVPGNVDAIVVPPGDDLSVPANQIEVAANVPPNTLSTYSEIVAATYDLLVFPTGDPRTDRATAHVIAAGFVVTDTEISTAAARGTVDVNDLPIAGVTSFLYTEPPSLAASGPRFHCVDIGGEIVGFCQQTCPADGSGFGNGTCQGTGMGCQPTPLQANATTKNLCGPIGTKALGDACNTNRTWGECGEGSYCLEYGNTVPNFDDVRRGFCTPYCVTTNPGHPFLQCEMDQACQPILYNNDFEMGECGFPCTPDGDYSDSICPAGLQSCKPITSLVDDPVGTNPPSIQIEQAFCSASGDIAADAACVGSDCVPGSECMFPRSAQPDFLGSLVSQYFGGPGLAPVCRPQCDPFDGDSSNAMCANGETCLFNFPWSAEVGHCTPIAEDVAPLSNCTMPGESCGEDAICIVNGDANVCFEFCQYEGPDMLGQLQTSGCRGGAVCNPFVNDIGICLAPAQ